MPNVNINVVIITGDVGGFMGLLLGGSVITVFELLDFIFRTTIYYCKNSHKKRPKSGNSQYHDNNGFEVPTQSGSELTRSHCDITHTSQL